MPMAILVRRHYLDASYVSEQGHLPMLPTMPRSVERALLDAMKRSALCLMNTAGLMSASEFPAIEPGWEISPEFGWCATTNLTWVFLPDNVNNDMFNPANIINRKFALDVHITGHCLDAKEISNDEYHSHLFLYSLINQSLSDFTEGMVIFVAQEPAYDAAILGVPSPTNGLHSCLMPPPIVVSRSSVSCIDLAMPSMNMYLVAFDVDRGFMDDVYLCVKDWVREFLLITDVVEVDLHPYSEGLPCFRVEDGVLMENLIQVPLSIDTLNDGIWASNFDFVAQMEAGFSRGVEYFIAWLNTYKIDEMYYNTLVSRHSGEYAAYTFSGFAKKQKRIEFQISIFDHDAFTFWFNEMQDKSPWVFHHARSLELDWQPTIASMQCVKFATPEAPTSTPSLMLMSCGEAIVTECLESMPKPIDALMESHVWLRSADIGGKLIAAGANAWLMPAMAFPQNSGDMFSLCEQILREASEDGIPPVPATLDEALALAKVLAFELHLRADKHAPMRTGMLLLTDIPQDDFGDLCLHGVIPNGPLDEKMENAINASFPTQRAKDITALPKTTEQTMTVGLDDIEEPEEEFGDDCL